MTSTLRTLLDRVEKEWKHDDALDVEIWKALCGPTKAHWPSAFYGQGDRPTLSIDAALDLVERTLPGWDMEVFRDRAARLVTVSLFEDKGAGVASGWVGQHSKEPRATLAALLRAKIAQEAEK